MICDASDAAIDIECLASEGYAVDAWRILARMPEEDRRAVLIQLASRAIMATNGDNEAGEAYHTAGRLQGIADLAHGAATQLDPMA